MIPRKLKKFLLFFAALSLSVWAGAASLKKVTGQAGSPQYDGALNQNFDRIGFELSNTVHQTSTETIHGQKYFVDPVDFGVITADTGTFTSLSATTATITFLTASTATVNNLLSMGGIIDMNSNKITELANGTAATDGAAFGQIPVVATQAQMEAATSNTVFASPGRTQYHPGTSKAYVVFNGTGTVSIKDSYNVSSITDNGVGDYTINFTNAFSSANYAGICTAGSTQVAENGTYLICSGKKNTSPTTTAFSISIVYETFAATDVSRISAVFFGDQ